MGASERTREQVRGLLRHAPGTVETLSSIYQKITVVLNLPCALLYTQTSPIESSGIPPGLSFCPSGHLPPMPLPWEVIDGFDLRQWIETLSSIYQKITVVLRRPFTLLYTQTSPIESSGIPPGLSCCPKEYIPCPTSPSDRAAIPVVHDSPKGSTAPSMRKRLREATNATNVIPAPASVTVIPGERPGKHSLKGIPSAFCVGGMGSSKKRRLPTTSRPPDMVVRMTRRTSWRSATAATVPCMHARESGGETND